MKTLKEIKNSHAVHLGFKDWITFYKQVKLGYIGIGYYSIENDVVAKQYAEQALDFAADEAMPEFVDGNIVGVDKKSILKIKDQLK